MTEDLSQQLWDNASKLLVSENHTIGSVSPIFTKVENSDIQNHKKKLENN